MPQLEVEKFAASSYTYYAFALYSGGLQNLFDLMRYDRAFFVRRKDVDVISQHIVDHVWHRPLPSEILLGAYWWKSPNARNSRWTFGRLLSTQHLTEVTDVAKLYELESDITVFKISKPLKYEIKQVGFSGDIQDVLSSMYLNQAMPYKETDSHKLEELLYREGNVTLDLVRYAAHPVAWL